MRQGQGADTAHEFVGRAVEDPVHQRQPRGDLRLVQGTAGRKQPDLAVARPEGEQVAQRDRTLRRHGVVERAIDRAQDATVGQFRQPVLDRIIETQAAFLHQDQCGHRRDRLGHRGEPEDGVACHRLGFVEAHRAQGLDVLAAAVVHERDDPGRVAVGDVASQGRAQAFQAKRREIAHAARPLCRYLSERAVPEAAARPGSWSLRSKQRLRGWARDGFTGHGDSECYERAMPPAARRRQVRATPPARIGCAGWAIPAAHRDRFGPGSSVLARYATRLDCVEINSSFYRPHRRDTYARWADAVPAHFRFSVKMPRAISHDARLRQCGGLLDGFLSECSGLGDKLGCLLLQLPPSLALDGRVAAPFLAMLRRRWDGPVACEPRHASWFTQAADALFQRHRIARVAADPAPHPAAAVPGGDPALAYWRWHGSPRMYYSAYDDAFLRRHAQAVAASAAAQTWVVFDNTTHGHAIDDALRFAAMLARVGR